MLYTDSFDLGHLVLRAGVSGLRITSNDDSKNLAIIDGTGEYRHAQRRLEQNN